MNKHVLPRHRHLAGWLIGAGVLAALVAAPAAIAEPVFPTAGSESASATVNDLEAEGFDVSINYVQGQPNVPLGECRVSRINNPSSPSAAPSMVTVYVDVLCPNAK
jgi:hypothetical protein